MQERERQMQNMLTRDVGVVRQRLCQTKRKYENLPRFRNRGSRMRRLSRSAVRPLNPYSVVSTIKIQLRQYHCVEGGSARG